LPDKARCAEDLDGRYQDEHREQPDHNVSLHNLSLSALPAIRKNVMDVLIRPY
jgi:hypothetical protein